jgi:hypothetical protein
LSVLWRPKSGQGSREIRSARSSADRQGVIDSQAAASSRSQVPTSATRAAPCLTCQASSFHVRWRPPLSVVIVTHLVTRSLVSRCRERLLRRSFCASLQRVYVAMTRASSRIRNLRSRLRRPPTPFSESLPVLGRAGSRSRPQRRSFRASLGSCNSRALHDIDLRRIIDLDFGCCGPVLAVVLLADEL